MAVDISYNISLFAPIKKGAAVSDERSDKIFRA